MSANSPVFHGVLADVYGKVGRIEEARALIEPLMPTPDPPPFFVALLQLTLGNHDEVFAWLDRGVRERGDYMHSLRTNPFFITEWKDPRFALLLERMGLGPPLEPPRLASPCPLNFRFDYTHSTTCAPSLTASVTDNAELTDSSDRRA